MAGRAHGLRAVAERTKDYDELYVPLTHEAAAACRRAAA